MNMEVISVEEKQRKIRIDIIALLIGVISLVLAFLKISVYICLAISLVTLIVYYVTAKRHYIFQNIMMVLCIISAFLVAIGVYLMLNTSGGLDSLASVFIYAFMIKIGTYPLLFTPLILLIVDNWNDNIVIIFIMGAVVGLIIGGFFLIRFLLATSRISEDIPTVADFEAELNQRGFSTRTANYRLYGIDSSSEKPLNLSFSICADEKYPLYIYTEMDYGWLIYYINGEIYAIGGKYEEENSIIRESYEERIEWDPFADIITETEEITTYNMKLNAYEKGKYVLSKSFNYSAKNKETENSIFVEIPVTAKEGIYFINVVDRVDKQTLDKTIKKINY